MPETAQQASQGRTIAKRILAVFAAILAAACMGMLIYLCIPLRATNEALEAVSSSDQATFTPQSQSESDHYEYGLVFYPGAKCEPTAYAPFLQKLADRGWLCIVVDAPFHFSLLNQGGADEPIASHPNVDHWYVGGHSMGGVAASNYAAGHTDAVSGVVLCAAYSAADLSQTNLDVISIYGSLDGVLNRERYTASLNAMPTSFRELVIEGGNHAQFGNYGTQIHDNQATISAAEQQTQAADFITGK